MASRRVGALKKAVVGAIAVLVGIGIWGAWALAQEPLVAVEYKCRVIAPGPAIRQDVTLQDQFDTEPEVLQVRDRGAWP